MNKFTFIYSYSEDVQMDLVQSHLCPPNYAYLVPGETNSIIVARSRYSLEKERNEWVRRYDRLLKGLRYWEAKAKENGRTK